MPASIEVLASHAPPNGPHGGFRARGIVYASAFGIGPLIGGVLTDNVSWRAVFWGELALLLVAMGVALPLLRATPQLLKPPTRDFLGAALAAVVVFLVVFIASRGRTWGWALWRPIRNPDRASHLDRSAFWHVTRRLCPQAVVAAAR